MHENIWEDHNQKKKKAMNKAIDNEFFFFLLGGTKVDILWLFLQRVRTNELTTNELDVCLLN
jgi:hypothetical protein